jgi:protein-disulfide isomerase
LFANQHALASEDLKRYARTLSLDPLAFEICLDRGKYREDITASIKAAASYTVPATPTVFINGRMIMGVAPLELYTRIIAEELGN